MSRSEQDKETVDKGRLWAEFKTTLFGIRLFEFFEEQEKLGKDSAFELLINDDKDGAKQAAAKLSGILAVKSFIEDSISSMNELLEQEKIEREERKSIPKHVA